MNDAILHIFTCLIQLELRMPIFQNFPFSFALLSLGLLGNLSASAQTPGQIFSVCSTVGNPLDPNGDGYISSTGAAFSASNLDEIDEFEGADWNVVWHLEGEPTADLRTGSNCGSTEIVDNPNTNQHAAYFRLVDPDTDPANRNEQLILRMRVARNPTGAFGYSFLIDLDGKIGFTGANADPDAVAGNPGFELEIIYGSGGAGSGVNLLDVNTLSSTSTLASYAEGARNQRSYAQYSNCTTQDPVFIDFYIDISSFPIGFDATTPLRLVFATSSSPNSALGGSASDIGGVDDDTFPDEDDAFISLVENTPISNFEAGALPPVTNCNDPVACNYDSSASTAADCTYASTWYADGDGDGDGDPNTTQSSCTQPTGYVATAGDFCDSDANKTSPSLCGCGAVDTDVDSDGLCDSSDNCTNTSACNYDEAGNGACILPATWYEDSDADGVGDANSTLSDCTAPAGYVAGPGDQCPNDSNKYLPGDCGCGTADVDADSDGISDCNDNCNDNTACNYNDAGNGACTYASTWYADTDSDGAGDPNDFMSNCTQPSGYVAAAGDLCPDDVNKTAPGTCGCGNAEIDNDADGLCDASDNCTDNTACNYDDLGNAACTYTSTWYADTDSDGAGDPNDFISNCTQPSGYVAAAGDLCPDDVNKTAPGTCGCGTSDADVDGDSIADCSDNCTDVGANNYNDPGNAACTYASSASIIALDSIKVCLSADALELDLDTLHSLGAGSSYGMAENLSGFASASLNASILSIDFSGTGAGGDTLSISVTNGATAFLKIPVFEYAYPVRTSDISIEVASSPNANDGVMEVTFDHDYGNPITIHLANGETATLVHGAAVMPSEIYSIIGFSNSKGCMNTAGSTSPLPDPSAGPHRVVLPCKRCD